MELFLQGLEQSGWLKHVKSGIQASIFIAEALLNGISVIVHCSDGWDRTSQTCALAQLLIDPFYRTIQGFQALIEKDWLIFGLYRQVRVYCRRCQGGVSYHDSVS